MGFSVGFSVRQQKIPTYDRFFEKFFLKKSILFSVVLEIKHLVMHLQAAGFISCMIKKRILKRTRAD
jgi:hypothetical protein